MQPLGDPTIPRRRHRRRARSAAHHRARALVVTAGLRRALAIIAGLVARRPLGTVLDAARTPLGDRCVVGPVAGAHVPASTRSPQVHTHRRDRQDHDRNPQESGARVSHSTILSGKSTRVFRSSRTRARRFRSGHPPTLRGSQSPPPTAGPRFLCRLLRPQISKAGEPSMRRSSTTPWGALSSTFASSSVLTCPQASVHRQNQSSGACACWRGQAPLRLAPPVRGGADTLARSVA